MGALIKDEDNLHYMICKYYFIQARKVNSIDWNWLALDKMRAFILWHFLILMNITKTGIKRTKL